MAIGDQESDPSNDQAVALAGLTLVVVDDDADILELLVVSLELRGACVVRATSADEGIKAIADERPDLVLSDIGMPGKDGYELIRELRASSPSQGSRTPAIALTAFTSPADHDRALSAGFQLHLTKPCGADSLVAAIKAASRSPGSSVDTRLRTPTAAVARVRLTPR